MSDWASLATALFWISLVVAVAGAIALPLLIVSLPADYFVQPRRKLRQSSAGRRCLPIAGILLRNILALMLFVAGLIMLLTPGQGLLMLLVAISLADFPGKRRLERWVVSHEVIATSLNSLRLKVNRPPLQIPKYRSGDRSA